MSETATTVEEPTTKLTLFWSSRDVIDSIRERLTMLPDMINHLGYGYKFQMPSVKFDKSNPPARKTENYINWRGKERTRTLPAEPSLDYHYYFEFVTPLTDDELRFWRTFKLGYLCRDFDPKGAWRNK